jgi:hypothetical protein
MAGLPPLARPKPMSGHCSRLASAIQAMAETIGWGRMNEVLAHPSLTGLQVAGDLVFHSCAGLEVLPDGLEVDGSFGLIQCDGIKRLPEGLRVTGLASFALCPGLCCMPDRLEVGSLIVLECPSVRHLPKGLRITKGSVTLLECKALEMLPADLRPPGGFMVRECPSLSLNPARVRFKVASF